MRRILVKQRGVRRTGSGARSRCREPYFTSCTQVWQRPERRDEYFGTLVNRVAGGGRPRRGHSRRAATMWIRERCTGTGRRFGCWTTRNRQNSSEAICAARRAASRGVRRSKPARSLSGLFTTCFPGGSGALAYNSRCCLVCRLKRNDETLFTRSSRNENPRQVPFPGSACNRPDAASRRVPFQQRCQPESRQPAAGESRATAGRRADTAAGRALGGNTGAGPAPETARATTPRAARRPSICLRARTSGYGWTQDLGSKICNRGRHVFQATVADDVR